MRLLQFALVLTTLLSAQACTREVIVYRPVEIEVPVPVRAVPPAELSRPYRPEPLPRFISPQDPAAKAALSSEDLNHLKTMLRTLATRDAAWRAWATTETEQ